MCSCSATTADPSGTVGTELFAIGGSFTIGGSLLITANRLCSGVSSSSSALQHMRAREAP